MSHRTVAWLAWSLCVLSLALTALAFLFLALSVSRPSVPVFDQWLENAAVAVLAGGTTLTNVVSNAVGVGWLRWVGFLPTIVDLVGLPAAVSIAILRLRLYNIDLLINRTLVYGSLTATLALIYFGGVAATEAIFRAHTGQEHQPQLAVVVSTLAIAALFIPLRRRIQSLIDRRFYHSKYDARKTLEAFSAKLRDEMALNMLSDELVRVVRHTIQPKQVSLWLHADSALKDKKRDDIRESGHKE
jgi:hypothetical protein